MTEGIEILNRFVVSYLGEAEWTLNLTDQEISERTLEPSHNLTFELKQRRGSSLVKQNCWETFSAALTASQYFHEQITRY